MNHETSSPAGGMRWWGALTLGYWLLMIVAFHMPIPRPKGTGVVLPPNSDKTVHLVIYAGFGGLLSGVVYLWCRRGGRAVPVALQALLLTAAVILYGYLDERTQPWTGRHYDLRDFAADIVGGVVGIGAFHVLRTLGLLRRAGVPA